MPPVRYHLGGFPPNQLDLQRLLPLVGPAHGELARYDGILSAVPNADVLLAPLITQEAVLSSRIEGTQATFAEVLEFEAAEETVSEEKKADIHEVLNYRAALRHAVAEMETLPLSQRLIKNADQVLMQGVRGQNRAPGEYRRVPNWIGRPGCTMEEARFVPPDALLVPEAMSAWERYVHADVPDKLIQLAILHAEFEAIHPFWTAMAVWAGCSFPSISWTKSCCPAPTSISAPTWKPAARNTTTGYWLYPETVTGPVGACSFSPPS